MDIKILRKNRKIYADEIAALLRENFPHAYGDCAEKEAANCLKRERIAAAAFEDGKMVGFIGAIPQYGTTGWELHPLMITKTRQFQGIGTLLVLALEDECLRKGGVMLYLGTDDEFGATSLSGEDLYDNTCFKMAHVVNLKQHPFEFYQKVGFKIVGVIPDANGIGKPDIMMAKTIVKSHVR